MRRALWACLLIAGLALSSSVLDAEAPEKPLTNADVASMVKTGLPESTILLVIQLASQRGSVDFDASPSALIELKKQGATEKILNAVLWAQSFRTASRARERRKETSAIPGLPGKPGVYYRSSSGWEALASTLLWPPLQAPWNVTAGFRRKEYGVVLHNPQARLQISEKRPTFYIRDLPREEGLQLLQLVKRKEHRELRVISDDAFFSAIGYNQSDVRDIELTPAGGGTFTVKPKADLDPGEYLLCTMVPGAHHLLLCYEFGISVAMQPGPS